MCDATTYPEVLTVSDCFTLANILHAAANGVQVVRVNELVPDGLVSGTARSIGDTSGNYLRTGEDVRGGYLRVTLTSGFDAYWPIAELVGEAQAGSFVIRPVGY